MGPAKRFEWRRVNGAMWFGFTWDSSWSNYAMDITLLLPFMQFSIGLGREKPAIRWWREEVSGDE